MSYPGVDLTDDVEEDSVGTQNDSPVSERQTFEYEEQDDKILVPKEKETPTPPKLSKAQIKAAVDEMFDVTDAWAPRTTKVRFRIDCPSGQPALVKHLETMDLLEAGLIEELDFFTRRLFPKNIDPSGNLIEATNDDDETLWQALRDNQKRRRFFEMTGKLIAIASLKPSVVFDGVFIVNKKVKFGFQLTEDERKVRQVTIPELKKGQTYAGAIDFADRMAFFHELNRPLKQIEPFRPEQAAVLSNLDGSQGNGNEAE